jgi:hypothetical protein
MKHNIMFDMAASIETEKSFEELSVSELVGAVCKRLHNILQENTIESFGFCDEYEVDETPNPENK